jgi:hypothetical protein
MRLFTSRLPPNKIAHLLVDRGGVPIWVVKLGPTITRRYAVLYFLSEFVLGIDGAFSELTEEEIREGNYGTRELIFFPKFLFDMMMMMTMMILDSSDFQGYIIIFCCLLPSPSPLVFFFGISYDYLFIETLSPFLLRCDPFNVIGCLILRSSSCEYAWRQY